MIPADHQSKIRAAVKRMGARANLTAAAVGLGPEHAPFLVRELSRMAYVKRRIGYVLRIGTPLFFAAWIIVMLASARVHGMSFWAGLFGLLSVLQMRAMSSPYQRGLERALAEAGGQAAIGPLAQAVYVARTDRAEQKDVVTALTRLLDRTAELPGLDRDQRSALFNTLKLDVEAHRGLHLALLRFLGRLRDPSAIPQVEELAAKAAAGAYEESVKEAALDCLAVLREAARAKEAGRTLLRPAEGEGASLLRPAESAETEDAALLRPME